MLKNVKLWWHCRNLDCLDYITRCAAVAALARLGDRRAVGPLSRALLDSSPRVRDYASRALQTLGAKPDVDLLIDALGHGGEAVAAAEALGSAGDPRAVDPLIKALGNQSRDVRLAVAEALGKLGTRGIESLTNALGSKAWDVSEVAAYALGGIEDARAVEALITALGDKHWMIRRNAADALGRSGDARAVEALTTALGDKESMVRRNAAGALGRTGGGCAVEALITALGDEEWSVREHAAGALGRIGDARAREPLMKAAADLDGSVACQAALALGKLGDTRAIGPLVETLWHPSGESNDPRSDMLQDLAKRAFSESNMALLEPLYDALMVRSEKGQWRDSTSLRIRRTAALALIAVWRVARGGPVGPHWQKVRRLVERPHEDRHRDNYAEGSSDCHSDIHEDTGIGLKFPDPPANLREPATPAACPVIRLRCPAQGCARALKIPASQAGKRAKCPACGTVIHIPSLPPDGAPTTTDF